MAKTRTLDWAAISYATAASHNLIAAASGVAYAIYGILLAAAGDVTCALKDGTTVLTGTVGMTLGKTMGPLWLDPDRHYPLWVLSAGNAFVMTLGGAVQVSGCVWFERE